MKQIILIGDFARWKGEADFVIDMLHLSAAGAVTINLGARPVAADLNPRELRRLFPGVTLAESVAAAAGRMYTQGIADGIMCLVGPDPALHEIYDRTLDAIPFGLPKAAIIAGDSPWKGRDDILQTRLPGNRHNLNPIIKICLCNTVFAVSGMALCNIHNFGSNRATIGVTGCCPRAEEGLVESGFNFLSFEGEDKSITPLLRHGYVHGLLIGKLVDSKAWLEMAAAREVPAVILGRSSQQIRTALAGFNLPVYAPIVVITPEKAQAAPPGQGQPWLKQYLSPYKYGTGSFYRQSINILAELLP